MTAGTHYGWFHSDVSRNYWLPPYGRGNGYDAPAWAPIANVPEELVDHLLAALAAADVPAHAAHPGLRNTATAMVRLGGVTTLCHRRRRAPA